MGKRKGIGKGTPGPGRKKGVPNKTTIAAKEAFIMAFDKLGGVDRLVRWANQYPTEFFKIYGRLIPMDVTSGGEKLTVMINVPPLPDGGSNT